MRFSKYLFFCIAALTIAFSFFKAQASVNIELKAVQLNGLDKFKGHHISMFLVKAHRAAFKVPGSKLNVSEVIGSPRVGQIDASGTVSFPKQVISRKIGFFNFLVFVVHGANQPIIFLKNPDGKFAKDLRLKDFPDEAKRPTGESFGSIYSEHPLFLDAKPNDTVLIHWKDID